MDGVSCRPMGDKELKDVDNIAQSAPRAIPVYRKTTGVGNMTRALNVEQRELVRLSFF